MNVWDELDEILDTYDSDFGAKVCSASCWSGCLRLTLTDPPEEPSRSMTFFSAGGESAEEVAEACLADARAWLAESGVTPMPLPAWMRD